MMISIICICDFMPNYYKKSWTVSTWNGLWVSIILVFSVGHLGSSISKDFDINALASWDGDFVKGFKSFFDKPLELLSWDFLVVGLTSILGIVFFLFGDIVKSWDAKGASLLKPGSDYKSKVRKNWKYVYRGVS